MDNNYFCAFAIGQLRCPKLGIYNDSPKTEAGVGSWYCAEHRLQSGRVRDYHNTQLLKAMVEDIREGRMSRGTSAVTRETDGIVDRLTGELDLRRGELETKLDFIARCRSKMKLSGTGRLCLPTIRESEKQALIHAGENPYIDGE